MKITNVGSNPYRQYLASKTTESTESQTEDSNDDSCIDNIKEFTCGLLGITQATDTAQETDSDTDQGSDFYSWGEYIKAAGTVGGIISVLV